VNNISSGTWQGVGLAALDALGFAGNLSQVFRICFTGEHLVDTKYGTAVLPC
jgi:hypothetical protein